MRSGKVKKKSVSGPPWLAALLFVSSVSRADNPLTSEPILPIPVSTNSVDMRKSSLGKELFFEKRLSRNETISCANCHDFKKGGADGLSHSIGINGQHSPVNAPSVFNSSLNFRQFWDGRAGSLEEQIDGPIQSETEMGSNWNQVIERLSKDSHYVKEFSNIYPDGISASNVRDSLASFEKTLLTPNSRFDRYLNGQQDAISKEEKIGYNRFKSFGCISCHQGVNVGGNMFQTMGVMGNYFKDRGGPITAADLGKYNTTKIEEDKFVFRVPSLRNVALTAPYFHDGSEKNLENAIRKMAKYQLGKELNLEEVQSLATFLKTLTGEVPAEVTAGSP